MPFCMENVDFGTFLYEKYDLTKLLTKKIDFGVFWPCFGSKNVDFGTFLQVDRRKSINFLIDASGAPTEN